MYYWRWSPLNIRAFPTFVKQKAALTKRILLACERPGRASHSIVVIFTPFLYSCECPFLPRHRRQSPRCGPHRSSCLCCWRLRRCRPRRGREQRSDTPSDPQIQPFFTGLVPDRVFAQNQANPQHIFPKNAQIFTCSPDSNGTVGLVPLPLTNHPENDRAKEDTSS